MQTAGSRGSRQQANIPRALCQPSMSSSCWKTIETTENASKPLRKCCVSFFYDQSVKKQGEQDRPTHFKVGRTVDGSSIVNDLQQQAESMSSRQNFQLQPVLERVSPGP